MGGLAFQLSGLIASYVSPGHDGKLFVSALLPLGLLALTLAIRDRRLEGYCLFALAVGLALLSPHPQMTQYFLVAAAIYAVYLALHHTTGSRTTRDLRPLLLALSAVVVGLGIGAIQMLPAYAYIPHSPRYPDALDSFAFSAQYGIPWEHIPEFFLSRFADETISGSHGTYWGPNGLKLHSEYLGLPVVALAVLGVVRTTRKPLTRWLCGIGILFLLLALGRDTPFYRLWWSVVPFAKAMRAPGMAFYITAFVVAVMAAFGADAVERQGAGRSAQAWLLLGAMVVALGAVGVFGALAQSLETASVGPTGLTYHGRALAAQGAIRLGAVTSGVALMAMGGLAWAFLRRRIAPLTLSLGLVAVIGTDLWWNAHEFWNYSRAQDEIFAADSIKSFLKAQRPPFRVWNVGVYDGSSLMADGIAQWFGHHGNELRSFDTLNGRDGVSLDFRNAGHPQLLDLFAIQYIIISPEDAPDDAPGWESILSDVHTATGRTATLYQPIGGSAYARLVPAAVELERDEIAATVLDPRFVIDRVVLIEPGSGVEPDPLPSVLPDPLDVGIEFVHWAPGHMTVFLEPPAPQDAYLLISENYYPDWQARVDGQPTPTLRGDGTLLTAPVRAGAREVQLEFVSDEYRVGRMTSLMSLTLVLAGLVLPPALRRRRTP